jgi:CheY-like chemotaxis protein
MANLKRERRRILLVDDNEDAREIAALTLEEHTLICACDFDQGLLAARRGYFDLYILDNWLPDGSGVELCRNIREFDPHTPILFNSAAAYARDIREAIRFFSRRSNLRPPSHVMTNCQPIPRSRHTASLRAPCPPAWRSGRASKSSAKST